MNEYSLAKAQLYIIFSDLVYLHKEKTFQFTSLSETAYL